ncbi:MAG: polyprenyl synthetase family protein [Rhodoferax sp.]|uniref:polyprenyl synthetase family protein n=1 Tax=Rhodoferax sp. TaxID=50421 RepID=UPI003BB7731B
MTDHFDLNHWCTLQLQRVEQALDNWVSVAATADLDHSAPAELMVAMRYAVLDGGKRLRPLLVMAAFEAVTQAMRQARLPVAAADEALALRAACAVELIHAYSLVHDDMPCMDNDVLRRGKPTVHVEFGSASALLAGDALQALAFELLTPEDASVPAARQARLCRLLARSAGCAGMAGGQAIDLASVGRALTEDQLRQMHQLKTGALLQASVLMGAACGDATAQALQALQAYGAAMGLAFQVVDDMLDVTADTATLGKTAGKDQAQDKPTYVSLMGLASARRYAQTLYDEALAALAASGLPDTRALQGLASLLVQRSS